EKRPAYAFQRIADAPTASYEGQPSMPSRTDRRKSDSAKPDEKRPISSESSPLTTRELEVVEWIVAGKRDREIAEILECSPRTVQKHVQHIFTKLNFETRTSVCTWWHESRGVNGDSAAKPPNQARD